MSQGTARKGTPGGNSCYKCGKPGHYANACQEPRENWTPYDPNRNPASSQTPRSAFTPGRSSTTHAFPNHLEHGTVYDSEAMRLLEPDPDKVVAGQPLPTEMKIVVDSLNVPVGLMVSKKGIPVDLDKDGNPRLIQMAWVSEFDRDEATGQLMKVLKHKKPVFLDEGLVPIENKRPKLDVADFVNTETGLASVYQKLPIAFRAIYKGPGHEAGDLQRLMELYQRWHDKLFPHCDFDVFLEKCETLGKKREIQTCLSTLRNKFVHGLDPYADCVGDDVPPAADELRAHTEPEEDAMDVEARRSLDAARQKAAEVQAARENEEDEEEELLRHLHDVMEPMDAYLSTPVALRAPPPVATTAEISAEQRERMEENKRRAMERLAARKTAEAAAAAAPTTAQESEASAPEPTTATEPATTTTTATAEDEELIDELFERSQQPLPDSEPTELREPTAATEPATTAEAEELMIDEEQEQEQPPLPDTEPTQLVAE